MSPQVSVTYSYGPNRADVIVQVDWEDVTFPPVITPALPQLSPGDWTVVWTLKAGSGVTNPKFDPTDGIVIDSDQKPPNLAIHTSELKNGTDGKEWEITLTNSVASANQAFYIIHGSIEGAQGIFRLENADFSHDPTIAVTTDPIGG